MRQLKTRISVWVLALVLLVSAVPTASAGQASDSLAQSAQTAAETALYYGGAVSVQYALWQEGEIVLTGQYGVYSKTENRVLSNDMLYGVGSISKVYTAAAVMKLVEQGKVALDAPVTRYLPDFKMADERYKNITVRMLLNHSSGLMGGTVTSSFLFADGSHDATEDLLEHLSVQQLQADPGAYSVYSNDSFSLAEVLIQQVSGMEYNEFLAKYITGPLGLDSTFTPYDDFDTSLLAKTYASPEETRPLPQETLAVVGCGGIYASAADLAAFGGALTSPGFLSERSLEAMEAEEYARGMWPEDSEDDALAYGLGWDNVHMFPFNRSGIQALVKGGDTLSYHAGLVILPEYDMACAVVSSGGVSTYNQAAAARILMDALAEQGVTVDETAVLNEAAPADMPEELMAYSGFYGDSTSLGMVEVSEGGVLSLNLAGVEQKFTYREDGSFRDEGNSALLKFVEDNGQVYLFQKGYAPLTGLAPVGAANYVLERLPDYEAPADALAAWQAREGKLYLQTNERYSSALYAFSGVFGAVSLQGMPDGYMLTNRIVSGDQTAPFVQIPGGGSRDSGAVNVRTVDGVEFLEINGGLYRDAASVADISAAETSYCTVESGDARWYRTGSAAGRTMSVELPEQGMFTVYDANMQMTASSWVYGDTSVTLPENGWIVFASGVPVRFNITMK